MEYINTIIEFLLEEQFFLGCLVAGLVASFIFYIYMRWYRTTVLTLGEIAHKDLLPIAWDETQTLTLRRKVLKIYSTHPDTTLEDLYYIGFEFHDSKLEKDPHVAKIIACARQRVIRNKNHVYIDK
jgi:hypothetical protein